MNQQFSEQGAREFNAGSDSRLRGEPLNWGSGSDFRRGWVHCDNNWGVDSKWLDYASARRASADSQEVGDAVKVATQLFYCRQCKISKDSKWSSETCQCGSEMITMRDYVREMVAASLTPKEPKKNYWEA